MEIQTGHSKMKIDIMADFSAYPAGRFHPADGDATGELFRNDLLEPKLREAKDTGSILEVNLEGVRTFGSSFLEEAFGGLIRECGWKPAELKKYLAIVYSSPGLAIYENSIWTYINSAKRQTGK